jgi:ATP-binding cassette subfamily C protein
MNNKFLIKINALFDRKEKVHFLGVMVIVLFSALLQTLSVALMLPFINLVMDSSVLKQSTLLNYLFIHLNFSNIYSFTVFLGVVLIIVIFFSNFFTILSTWLKVNFIWQKNHNLSSALLKKYLSLPYVYFLNKNSADLKKNILSEVQQLTGHLFMPLLSLITSIITSLTILLLLFFVDFKVTIIAAFLFIFSYGIIFFYLKKSLEERGEKRIAENTGRFVSAGEALEGIKDIKVLGREKYFFEEFFNHSMSFSKLQAWSVIVTNIPRYFMEIVAFGGVVILMLVSISLGEDGKEIIPLVGFFVFAGYRLIPALQEIFYSFTNFQFNKAVLDKIYNDIYGDIAEDHFDNKELPKPLPLEEKISFNNVSFSYQKDKSILKNVSFQVNKNTSVGIVGPTGGGKTTLMDLILGLLTPTQGAVMVDGIEVKKENVRNWQRNIGYVPQQVYLSDNTIARNIAFGIPDEQIDMKRIEEVAKIANIDDFIKEDLSSGYDTLTGERGVRLSGGQKQRIGIARALYHNPDILVLDEATSSLDGTTEKAVLEALDNVAKMKTIIIVAHRFKTVEHCDILYVLDKGEIVAQGNYKDLLKSNIQFQKMAKGIV